MRRRANWNPGERSEGPFSRREEGWELGEEKAKEKEEREKEKGAGQPPADLHLPLDKREQKGTGLYNHSAKVGRKRVLSDKQKR